MSGKKQKAIRVATEAHTNLNTFGIVVAILEGGCLYGSSPQRSALRIIEIAKAQMQAELALLEGAIAVALADNAASGRKDGGCG